MLDNKELGVGGIGAVVVAEQAVSPGEFAEDVDESARDVGCDRIGEFADGAPQALTSGAWTDASPG